MSAKLHLTLACGDYEITRPLIDGRVRPAGIDLVVITPESRERHWRVARDHAYDICEFNTPAYFMGRDRGLPYVSLPIYLHRRFRHGFLFVNSQKCFKEPKDLIGKRVGVPEYSMTAAVFARGFLRHEYGVGPETIEWFSGTQDGLQRPSRIDFDLPGVTPLWSLAHARRVLEEAAALQPAGRVPSPRIPISCAAASRRGT